MIEKIMKLTSLMLMLGEVSQLPEGYKKKYLEASKELEVILEENYNTADVASNASVEARSSLATDDEIETQVQNLMARLKLAQHFQMAESINKDNEIFNKFGFIDYLRGKISDKENNASVEKQKEELSELIDAVENYINENSINAKKNRLKEMLTKLKSTLEHTDHKILEDILEAQVKVIQAEIQAESDEMLGSAQDNLDEKKKDFLTLINAGKITNEQIEEFWDVLQLQIWLVKVEKIEQSVTVDSEEFFDAAENQANENEEAAKYKKEQEEWQNFLHELKEKLARLS